MQAVTYDRRDPMEGLYFGPIDQQLFAAYHPAIGGSRSVLTVICPPLFSDYMRTQRALRELAGTLADKGQHVLRFDYRGTGDSFAELADVTVSDWVEDIALAVREGCDLSGSSELRLVGVRAGALLACRYAVLHGNVKRLVLWDPVTDGTDYLRTLHRIQATILEGFHYLTAAERREASHEYAGYRLSERMIEDFRQLDARAYTRVPKGTIHVVHTLSKALFPIDGVARQCVKFACNWETDLFNVMMAKPVLEGLTACLTER